MSSFFFFTFVAITSPVCSIMCQNVRDTCPPLVTDNVPADCNVAPFSAVPSFPQTVPGSNTTLQIFCTDTTSLSSMFFLRPVYTQQVHSYTYPARRMWGLVIIFVAPPPSELCSTLHTYAYIHIYTLN